MHPRYLGDAEFYEQYDGKIFLARAGRMFFFLAPIFMTLEFSERVEICRAPRTEVRAPEIFLSMYTLPKNLVACS